MKMLRVYGKSFNSSDLMPVSLHSKDQARAHRLAVEQDRASAANAMLTANVGSG
jgi:hypothetical protein